MIDAYPICWPDGWPRHQGRRERGVFQGTQGKIQRELLQEIDRLVLGHESRGYTLNPGEVTIQKTIEALRGIERWGSSDMLDRAFTGFAALPAPGPRKWFDVLGMNGTESPEAIKARFRELAKRHHPDNGGTGDIMAEINTAYQDALKERGAA